MNPIPSADGLKVNWVNYRTRLKDVHFRMDAGRKSATIGIMIQHSDSAIQELYFEQFLELRDMLHGTLKEEWEWRLHEQGDEGKIVSKIFKETLNVSVLNRDHWPQLISFFKERMIALDNFWENAKYSFDALK
jgi:hypothetical protein